MVAGVGVGCLDVGLALTVLTVGHVSCCVSRGCVVRVCVSGGGGVCGR